jgi:hypothetical protein
VFLSLELGNGRARSETRVSRSPSGALSPSRQLKDSEAELGKETHSRMATTSDRDPSSESLLKCRGDSGGRRKFLRASRCRDGIASRMQKSLEDWNRQEVGLCCR